MAVPKKRTGHSAQGHRRSNWKATRPTTTKCPNCGEVLGAFVSTCPSCGYELRGTQSANLLKDFSMKIQ